MNIATSTSNMTEFLSSSTGPAAIPTWVYSASEREFIRKPPLKAGEKDPWDRIDDTEDDRSDIGYCWSVCSDLDCENCSSSDPFIGIEWWEEDAVKMDDDRRTLPSAQPLVGRYCENSYVTDMEREQYMERWIVNYQRCHPAQLKRFVRERGLVDPFPQGITLKYYYIRLLEHADGEWSFRLMDLPPEMRMRVYRALLIEQKRHCRKDALFPAILQTNKQVHCEAHEILYHENIFSVEYGTQVLSPDSANASSWTKILNVRTVADCIHGKFLRLPHAIDEYPDFLRRVSHIEITLSYVESSDANVARVQMCNLNKYLWGLASFLMEGHRLKALRLEISDWPSETAITDVSSKILYPLRRLRNIKNVVITDRLPEQVAARLKRDLQSHEPSFNTMRHWRYLDVEATETHRLFALLTERCDEGYMEYAYERSDFGDDEFERFTMAHDEVVETATIACFGSRAEEKFMANLSYLRRTLRDVDVAKLSSILLRLQTGRRERADYEATTDNGRLEEAERIWHKEYDRYGEYELASQDEWSDDEDGETAMGTDTTSEMGIPQGQSNAVSSASGTARSSIQHPTLNSDQIDAVFERWAPEVNDYQT